MLRQVCLNTEERPIDWTFFKRNKFCHAFKPDEDKCLFGYKLKCGKMLNPVPYSVIEADFNYICSDEYQEDQRGDVRVTLYHGSVLFAGKKQ